jgi:MFS family permease
VEVMLDSQPRDGDSASFWNNPVAWFREKNLGRQYWTFFAVAFFFDAGFSIYVFLFNLYLLDVHFNERAIGLIGGAMMLGSLAGLLPAGALARKFGIKPLLFFCLTTAPLLSAARAMWMWEPAQIGLGFITGVAMCGWGVCFLPAVARLTTENNRTSAFTLIFSASLATAAIGGVICGYLQQWAGRAGLTMQPAEVKRLILLASCATAALGLIPALRLRLPAILEDDIAPEFQELHRRWFDDWKMSPFLLRFLPLMAAWSAVLASFTPFANIYLSRDLNIPITQIGLIFSTVQIVQFSLGLFAPFIFRAVGLVNGIVAMQIFAAATLALLAGTRNSKLAIGLYLVFAAVQWMCAPGLYNLLMNETPDKDRSTASAMTMFSSSLAGSGATAGAGILFTRFGYPPVLVAIATLAVSVAVLFRLLMRHSISPDLNVQS